MRNETISEQEKELRRRRSEKVQAWWRNPENRRNETISEEEKELRRRRSEKVQAWWRNPENRRIMLEKQKRIGYRNYGDGIFYSINSKRRT